MSNFVALIVEDDAFQREFLVDLLRSEGLEVVECANGEVAELVLASTGPELRALVTDVELGGEMSGVQLAQYAKRKFPDLNVVMISGHGPPYFPHGTHFLMKALSATAATRRRPEVKLRVLGAVHGRSFNPERPERRATAPPQREFASASNLSEALMLPYSNAAT
jgi:CheY-like chemotaxis protein